MLARLSEDELTEVRERAVHLNELLYGYRSGSAELAVPGEPRPQYVPGLPKMRRYQAKADELGVSLSTVLRWVAAFHAEKEAGLARRRPERPADLGGVGRADPRWVEMALEVMSEYGDESTPGKATVLRAIGPRLAARYPGHEIKLPKRSTAHRYLKELDNRVPTFRLSAKRNRDIAARPASAYGRLRPTRPGEYVLVDTTRLDVFGLDPLTLRWVQAELTVAMDWYTRCIVGLRLTPWSTKSIDVAASLFQLYRPRPAGKDWPPTPCGPTTAFRAVFFWTVTRSRGRWRTLRRRRRCRAVEGPRWSRRRSSSITERCMSPSTSPVSASVSVSRSSRPGCGRAGTRARSNGSSGHCGRGCWSICPATRAPMSTGGA